MSHSFQPQPTTMIPILYQASKDYLEAASSTLRQFEIVSKGESTIDSDTVYRTKNTYSEQGKQIPDFLNQCKIWLQESLSRHQKDQVIEIEDNYKDLQKITRDILKIVNTLNVHRRPK